MTESFRRLSRLLRALTLIMIACGAAEAGTILFDFESQATTPNTGALTSLPLSRQGLDVTITRPGSRFDVNFVRGAPVPQFGMKSLSPFFDPDSATAFIANFSLEATAVAIDLGDKGGDADTLMLEAFSGVDAGDTFLGSALFDLGEAEGFPTLSVIAPGIRSIRFIGGGVFFPNSVWYDNLRITIGDGATVPEPATMLLLGTGLAGIGGVLRRRRKAKAE